MTITKLGINMANMGLKLKSLRKEHGYSQIQLAEYLKIDQSNLSKIENNKRNLNLTLLDKICLLYNCTPEYLLGESDEYEKQKIMFKSGNDMDLNAIAKINKLSCDLSILRKYSNPQEPKLPKLNINIRRHMGIDEYSPMNLFTLITQKIQNLTIVSFPMKRSVNGCCFKKDYDFIILINSMHSIGRRNFTLAHELYHLLNDDENFYICSEGLKNKIEEKADEFAFNLLMTKHGLYEFMESNNINEWSIEDIIKCEQYFQIDHNSLIRRLYCENFINGTQFAEFSFNIIDKASRLGYDTSLYESPKDKKYNSIGHMIPLTEKLWEEEKIGNSIRKDILLDLYKEELIYKSLSD